MEWSNSLVGGLNECITLLAIDEKMTLFWHGHFATERRKSERLSDVVADETLRMYALGIWHPGQSNLVRPSNACLTRSRGEPKKSTRTRTCELMEVVHPG